MAEPELVALAERIQAAFLRDGRTLVTAESCTGGLVAHAITEIPGSSDYFVGGLVTYDNDVKTALADVPPSVLNAHGAVSAQVALAMAEGTRRRLGVDVAVSVTGVAGPDGGSDTKPVGLTYVGIADAGGDDVRRHLWSEDRSGNKRASAAAALSLVLERLVSTDT